MIIEQHKNVNIALIYLWLGFICAISFMEAWLKYRAPGITIELGLGIGQLVFNALNKMEWLFAIIIVLNLFYTKQIIVFNNIVLILPLLILIIQTTWLLPILDTRAEMVIKGEIIKPSNYHFYYVGAEVIKVCSLVVYSFKILK